MSAKKIKLCNGKCKKPKGDIIKCFSCENEFHAKCIGVNDELYASLKSDSRPQNVAVYCDFCLEECKDSYKVLFNKQTKDTENIKDCLSKLKTDMKKMQEEFSARVDEMEKALRNKLEEQESNVNQEIKTYSQTVTMNIDESKQTKQEIKSISKNFNELKKDLAMNISKEKEEKIKISRKNNICFFKIPETNLEDPAKRYESDVKKVNSILRGKIDLKREDFKAIFRRGEVSENKTRPIIMILNNMEKRTELLKLRNLTYEESNTENNETTTNNIYIAPDRTWQEQEVHRKLVLELKERKQKGEDNIYIKNGKIMKFQPFRVDSHLFWE